MRKVSLIVFLLLVALIPLNIGKHFLLPSSYVLGLSVDYLVPTLYLQDILAFILLPLGVLGAKRSINQRETQLMLLFLIAVFLSSLISLRFVSSFTSFVRLFLYAGVFFYTSAFFDFDKHSRTFFMVLGISIASVSLLGILQFLKQGAVFNNYLVFGEQPYAASIPGVVLENVFGHTMVGAYGLFRHPNTFAGFLCVTLLLILPFVKRFKFLSVPLVLGVVSLCLTFSYVSYTVFIVGLVFLLFIYCFSWPNNVARKLLATFFMLFISYYSLFLPLLHNTTTPSLYRRENLLSAAYTIIKHNPLFGVGFNNFTAVVDHYYLQQIDYRFTQPVHNIFILIFAESGVFAFILFMALTLVLAKQLVYSNKKTFLVLPFLAVVVLGSFDHYLVTSQQGLLFLMLVFGLTSSRQFT